MDCAALTVALKAFPEHCTGPTALEKFGVSLRRPCTGSSHAKYWASLAGPAVSNGGGSKVTDL